MKTIIVLLFAITTTFTSFAQTRKSKTPIAKADISIKAKYSCSMHPEVVSNKPGKCSKCGMTLTKIKTYSCPMHPGVKSTTKGKCPECGMDLVEIKANQKLRKANH